MSPKIDRGIKYKFGWINSSNQKTFMKSVDLDEGTGPKLLLVNPGKRKKFYILENDLNEENISNLNLKL